MGKIGDLWVRLGLKKQDFDKGIDSAERRLSGFGKAFNVLKNVALGAFAAIVTAAGNMFDSLIRKSQRLSDQWDVVISQMTAVWDTFLGSLAAWNWESFGNRIRSAMSAYAANTQAHDELTEVQNANRLKRAAMQDELAQLQILARDSSKSQEERAAAAKRYWELVKPLYDSEIAAMDKIRKTEEDLYLSQANVEQSGANRANLEGFLKEIAPDRTAMEALLKKAEELKGETVKYSMEEVRALDRIASADSGFQGNAVEALAAIASYYQNQANDEDTARVIAAVESLGAATAGLNEETRRLQNIANSAGTTKGKGGGGTISSAWAADRNRAKAIQKEAEDSLKSEETLLAEHYETNKRLLQKYHLDTTALTEKYYNDLLELAVTSIGEIEEDYYNLQEIVEEPIEIGEIDTSNLEKVIDAYEEGVARMQALKDEFIQSVVQGFSDGVQEMTDQLFGLSEVNPGAIVQALLSPLADMAIREGEILMAQGLGVEAVKESLTTLNGAAAVAAGAALMAIGAAAKSGLAALAKGGSGTTVQSYSGNGSAATGEVIRSELVVRVEGTLKGSDIVLSGTQTEKSWNR